VALFASVWGVDAVLYWLTDWPTISRWNVTTAYQWPLWSSVVSYFFGFISGHMLWGLVKRVRK